MVVVAVLLAVSAPFYFARGIGVFDDSLYLKAGQLILDGLIPYRDFYDIKPPGIYYLSAAIAAVGGRGWLAPRIFLFAFAAIFQVVFVRWVQRQSGARAATIAAVLIGLSYPLCQGYSLHTEPFGAAAAFAACVVVLACAPSMGRWALAGALLGLATIFKQTGILYLAAFGMFAVFDVQIRNRASVPPLARLIALVGGFVAVLGLMLLAMVAQGLARPFFDAVVVGALDRADFPFQSAYAIARTWIFCPAWIGFLGVAVLLSVSRAARRAMEEEQRRAFGLYACVGVFSILPTLKQGWVGHYLQPGAFAFSAACGLFLDAYLEKAGVRARLVTATMFAGMTAYFVAVCGANADMLHQNKIRADLLVQDQVRQTFDARLDPDDSVLCVSGASAPRLYLMSGRHPFNHSLFYYPTTDWLFSLDDARRVLFDGRAKAALVEINPVDDRPALTDDELATLRSVYDIVPLGPQKPLRLLALIRYNRNEPSKRL